MKENFSYHYDRIAKAIEYLDTNFKQQPSLEEVADHVHMSPFHFQKMFNEWVGISPKKYLQFLSVNYAKHQLKQKDTLFKTALNTGLSGTSRLHDLFVNIEGMTPGEYKNGGTDLTIKYSFTQSPFGQLLIASTHKGICYMQFMDDEALGLNDLRLEFPNATFKNEMDDFHKNGLLIFQNDWKQLKEVKLHLKGTDFQLKIWETLLSIPEGKLVTYGDIAKKIEQPKASRAVGTAIGNNPIAFLIPCHRVIQQSGKMGGYRWNPIRKKAIIGWEAAKCNSQITK